MLPFDSRKPEIFVFEEEQRYSVHRSTLGGLFLTIMSLLLELQHQRHQRLPEPEISTTIRLIEDDIPASSGRKMPKGGRKSWTKSDLKTPRIDISSS
ncbi:phosphoribosylglycinamide formyltransferase [Moniliophthora roreri]|nr:phosphoribosylglycinamide formyltransferase [Moniliophthora roreri]